MLGYHLSEISLISRILICSTLIETVKLSKVLYSQSDFFDVSIDFSDGLQFFYILDSLFHNAEKNKLGHYLVQFQLSSFCIYLIGAYTVHNVFRKRCFRFIYHIIYKSFLYDSNYCMYQYLFDSVLTGYLYFE